MVLLTALLCAGVLGLAAAVTAILFLVSRWSVAHLSRRRGGATVLCVTAHPDDESMFFVPVLRCAAAAGMRVHLLCLSTGNAEGLGDRRRGELRAAWRALALPDGTVDVVDDPRLQDGMRTVWDVDSAAAIVQDCLRRMPGPCTVVTFDARGVSGHPNHVSTHAAVRKAVASRANVVAWSLETTSVVRKYCGALDAVASLSSVALAHAAGRRKLLFAHGDLWRSHKAMSAHASQYVWYRVLFVLFSRHTLLATMDEIR